MPTKQTEEEAQRSFTHGSSGATADMAVEGGAKKENRHIDAHRKVDTPHAREVEPLPEDEKHDHMAARQRDTNAEDRQEALLDEALEETFPGSDPISPKHIT
ncbi:MAG: hypothetical protein ABI655_06705 [Phenylobacterium sp.]